MPDLHPHSHPPALFSAEEQLKIKAESERLLHHRIRDKLYEVIDYENVEDRTWFKNFRECGQGSGAVMWCEDCGQEHPLLKHCSLKFCPMCSHRITRKRREKLDVWSLMIRNAKHVVMTQRNFETLSRQKIVDHYNCLRKIRRNTVFKNVKGGCVSVEMTNKTMGWHLHSHWLLDSSFIDMKQLSVAWGQLVGQEYGIVSYTDCQDKSYTSEVLKYVVKGSEMANWEPQQILDFIHSIRGSRFFFQFGSMFKMRDEVKNIIASNQFVSECEHCESTKLKFVPSHLETIKRMRL